MLNGWRDSCTTRFSDFLGERKCNPEPNLRTNPGLHQWPQSVAGSKWMGRGFGLGRQERFLLKGFWSRRNLGSFEIRARKEIKET